MADAQEGRQTYYVVQSFAEDREGVRMDEPIQAQSETGARQLAERLSMRKTAVLAFERSGNPSTGEFDDAKVLVSYGEIPAEMLESMTGDSF